MTIKFVISHKARSYQVEKDANVSGKKIGDTFHGDAIGLDGYELKITGGSDKDGFPMRPDIEGTMRRRIIVTAGVGMRSDVEGLRKRRTLRGNTIAEDIAQVNCVVTKEGHKNLEELLGKAPKEEAPKE